MIADDLLRRSEEFGHPVQGQPERFLQVVDLHPHLVVRRGVKKNLARPWNWFVAHLYHFRESSTRNTFITSSPGWLITQEIVVAELQASHGCEGDAVLWGSGGWADWRRLRWGRRRAARKCTWRC